MLIMVFVNCMGQVVFKYAKDRAIVFSSFQPDAALLLRKLQNKYPVSNLSCLFLLYLCCSLDHKQVKKLSPNDCCFDDIPGLLFDKWGY